MIDAQLADQGWQTQDPNSVLYEYVLPDGTRRTKQGMPWKRFPCIMARGRRAVSCTRKWVTLMFIPDYQWLMRPFQPEYAGKGQFYLALPDDPAREEGEKPSIGMILCKTKKRTIVEYALQESNKAVGVSKYRVVSSLPAGAAQGGRQGGRYIRQRHHDHC